MIRNKPTLLTPWMMQRVYESHRLTQYHLNDVSSELRGANVTHWSPALMPETIG